MADVQSMQDELASKQRERSALADQLNHLQDECDALHAQIRAARSAQRAEQPEQPARTTRGKQASE